MKNQKEGVLILVEDKSTPIKNWDLVKHSWSGEYHLCTEDTCSEHGCFLVVPIIVCDDEIKEGDSILYETGIISKCITPMEFGIISSFTSEKPRKVLVDTPQIPDHIIEAIVDGNLKDGDKVFVEMNDDWKEFRDYAKSNDVDIKLEPRIRDDKAIVTILEKENDFPILYTEEEVINLLYKLYEKLVFREQANGDIHSIKGIDDWFEQHKKK